MPEKEPRPRVGNVTVVFATPEQAKRWATTPPTVAELSAAPMAHEVRFPDFAEQIREDFKPVE